MNVIVFASRKGGSGKSTLAAHLAAHVHKTTKPCLMVDADPQGSLTLWHKLRGTNEPQIKTAVNSVSGIVAAAKRDGYEWVFIDTPPNLSAVVDDAIKNATMVVIPARPGVFDVNAVQETIQMCRAARKPYAVVLLDEIEKAHPDVFNVLLQLLDDGRLTDSQGRVVNFKNTIVIMTSNIGTAEVAEMTDPREIDNRINTALRAHFRPEFLNRVDEIVVFRRLDREDLNKIVDIQVATLASRLEDKKVKLTLTDKAKELLGRQGYDPVYGARPLKRVIQHLLQDPLALRLLQGELKENQTVTIDAQGVDLVFDVV